MIHVAARAVLGVVLAMAPLTFPGAAQADPVRQQQWMLDFLDIDRVHEISTGTGVIVGLPDTGVEPHPDLKQSLLPGVDLLGDGTDRQEDTDGHGTAMAGLIAGRGHSEGSGVLGVAPSAKILPIIASGPDGGALKIGEGIELAIEKGARVVNVSSASPKSLTLRRAVETAARSDVLVVAAIGNTTKTFTTAYPAALPGVLAVGAVGRDGKHAAISVTGGNIALCAPGVDVVSTGRGGKYVTTNGTSSATAVVSGAAALVRAKFPELSAAEVMHRLTATADDIGPPGRDDECGYGVLNIVRALTADVDPLPVPTPTSSGSGRPAGPAASLSTAASLSASAPAPSASGPRAADSSRMLFLGVGGVACVAVLLVLAIRRRAAR